MKKSFILLIAPLLLTLFSGCLGNGEWEKYEAWRDANNAWYQEMAALTDEDGSLYYTRISPNWNPSSGTLIHYFNDRKLTEGNLSPRMNSTVDVIYYGRYYNDEAFDSSYLNTEWGDSIFRTQPYLNIEGWQVALLDMRVGDSAVVVIPYTQAYGSTGNTLLPPYTALKFNIKLVDIPAYEISEDMIE